MTVVHKRCVRCGVNLAKDPLGELCRACLGEMFPGGSPIRSVPRAESNGDRLGEDARVRAEDERVNGRDRGHRLDLRSFAQMIAEIEAAGPREWDVEGIIVHGHHGALGSTQKAGKGFDVVDLAISVASGTSWLGRFPCPHAGPVALYPGEEDDHELQRRLVAVAEARGLNVNDLPLHIARDTPRFRRPEDLTVFRRGLEDVRPRLTMVDPMYKAAAGGDPKFLAAMGELLSDASDIARDLGSSFLTVPHFNRDTSRKGADRFTGAGPAEWGRFLIAATVDRRRALENEGTEVTRRVEVSGMSIADRVFVVTRRVTPTDPTKPDAPLIYEVEVTDAPVDGGPSPHGLSMAERRVLDALGPPTEGRRVGEIGDRVVEMGWPAGLARRTIERR